MKKFFLVACLLGLSATIQAAVIEIGSISAGLSNGQWQLTVENNTGANSAFMLVPVTTSLSIAGILNLVCDPNCDPHSSTSLSFGPIAPENSGEVVGNFGESTPFVFNSFTFNGNIAPTAFVADGVNYVSNGTVIVTNQLDFGEFYQWVLAVEGEVANNEIPEPTAMALVAGGLLAGLWQRRNQIVK